MSLYIKPAILYVFVFLALANGDVFAAEDLASKWERTPLPGLKNPLICRTDDPSMCVLRLELGEKAPWAGILQTDRQAAELAVRADPDRIEQRIKEAVDAVVKLSNNELEFEKRKSQIDLNSLSTEMAAMEENYEKRIELVEAHWYQEPMFVIPVTVLVTLGAVAATVAIADQLKE
jgi:hypothetical protein